LRGGKGGGHRCVNGRGAKNKKKQTTTQKIYSIFLSQAGGGKKNNDGPTAPRRVFSHVGHLVFLKKWGGGGGTLGGGMGRGGREKKKQRAGGAFFSLSPREKNKALGYEKRNEKGRGTSPEETNKKKTKKKNGRKFLGRQTRGGGEKTIMPFPRGTGFLFTGGKLKLPFAGFTGSGTG